MTARVLRRWIRPDKGFTHLRGNVQYLPESGNVLAGWSDRGYMSEFTSEGSCILEGDFASGRFCTYRAYKFNFKGTPTEPPVLKTLSYAGLSGEGVSTFHVSWNGATEVALWKFHGSPKNESDSFVELGSVSKTGFETTFVSQLVRWSYAEAIAANGTVLGKSETQESNIRGTGVDNNTHGRESLLTTSQQLWQPSWSSYAVFLMVVGVASFTCTGLVHCYLNRSAGPPHRYQSVPDSTI
jgi:hypothetical protein